MKLYVSDSTSVHHQDFFTVHTAMAYVMQICWQLASCQQTCMTYTIAVCTVKNSWWWTEELSETCGVSFQNKFEKLVHLVGFIIRNASTVFCNFIIAYYICPLYSQIWTALKIQKNQLLTKTGTEHRWLSSMHSINL